ncbi:outer membrane protein assembly factor BamB family protein [Adhaeretor mobilis]|uniref:Outer membrane protein assembly factor BamB n=1 Tax=Adhaeretor mobilis TaxID=1930276 RepID=A0A517MX25_9BACT|nr:PQQ-binding-like beta-propeller repeat protein [Adhaeretor mobilis]QDS99435.1 Outer membrane protein assembly factor BamB [Adhaeretor mobilis]
MMRFHHQQLQRQQPPRCIAKSTLVRQDLCALFLLAMAVLSAELSAQPGQIQLEDFNNAGVELPQDRNLTRGIRKAKESLAKEEYTQSLRFLDAVLAGSSDYFIESQDSKEIVGLKDHADQLLSSLPADGREAYLATYAPTAERRLRAAIESGEREDFAEIVQRYYHTPSGYEAALLLAQRDTDEGRTLLAALAYQRLLNTPAAVLHLGAPLHLRAAICFISLGDETAARAALEPLRQMVGRRIEIGGSPTKLTDDRTTVAWVKRVLGTPRPDVTIGLEDWAMLRGSPSRNAESQGGLPHMRIRWSVRLLSHPRLEQIFGNLFAEKMRKQELTPVAGSPLAVGNTVLVRSPHSLVAVNFKTGKRVWQAEPQGTTEIEELIAESNSTGDKQLDPEPARVFGRSLWRDHLYGTINSDGRRVFVIRDLTPLSQDDEDPFAPAFGRGHQVSGDVTNRLCAYDLQTQGKLLWEIDCAVGNGPLVGGFFLGSPLSLGDDLYGLIELRNSVHLYAVKASTGEVHGQQQLVNLDRGIGLDSRRRLLSSSPSYASGMLVSPIGAGIVIGVDLTKHSLGWAYRYEVDELASPRYRRQEIRQDANPQSTWTDAATILAAGRVLITPPDSSSIHCIDLQSGKRIWKKPKGSSIRLACVDSERVLLVGPSDVKLLSVENGKQLGETIKFPAGTSPSGSGFLSDGKYYLPLSSAEVIAIDVTRGEIVARSTSRDGNVLGNLVCHQGAVLSYDGQFLQRFDQIEVLRKQANALLAKSPQDVEALRTLGEVAYNEGRLSEAVSLLERAFRGDEDSYSTREILVQALVTALEEDFVTYRNRIPMLEKLQDGSPDSRARLQRIKASGLTESGELLAAADSCLEIYNLGVSTEKLYDVEKHRKVAVPRWISGQMANIWSQADPQIREKLAAKFANVIRSESVLESQGADEKLAFFGSMLDDTTKLKLTKVKLEEGELLGAQMRLQELMQSSQPEVRDEAIARAAALLHSVGQHRQAYEYDQLLAGPLANTVCLDGKTGAQIVAGFSVAALPEVDWPTGRVEAISLTSSTSRRTSRSPQYGIRMEQTDEVLGGCQISFSRVGELTIRDSLGKEFFRTMIELQQRQQVNYRQIGNMHAASHGNVVVVSFGRQIAAFNTLAGKGNNQPAILWQKNLSSELGSGSYHAAAGKHVTRKTGSYRASRSTWDGNWIGVIGPVTAHGCVYQDQSRLVCVDPLDGRVLWSRGDVPAGCDLFGDSDLLFVTPEGSARATVYSMIDGREIDEVEVPPWHEHLTTLGRNVISWSQDRGRPEDQRWEIASIDASTGETQWSYLFPDSTRVDIDRGRFIATVTPTGEARIIDGLQGDVLVESSFGVAERLKEIHLSVGSASMLLLTNRVENSPNNSPNNRRTRPINTTDYAIINGRVDAFDRNTGESLWARPAELDHQGWSVTQPSDLPVLMFVASLSRHDAQGSRQGITLLALDRRTGASLYRTDALPGSSSGHFQLQVSDESQHVVQAEMSSRLVQLRFTDKPRPPMPPAMAEVESSNVPTAGGLQRILQKLGNDK